MNITKTVKTEDNEYKIDVKLTTDRVRLSLEKVITDFKLNIDGNEIKEIGMLHTKVYTYNKYTDLIAMITDFVNEYEEGKVQGSVHDDLQEWDGIIE